MYQILQQLLFDSIDEVDISIFVLTHSPTYSHSLAGLALISGHQTSTVIPSHSKMGKCTTLTGSVTQDAAQEEPGICKQ